VETYNKEQLKLRQTLLNLMAAQDQPLTKRNFWRIWINYFKILTKKKD
jgi:hypothetical protein